MKNATVLVFALFLSTMGFAQIADQISLGPRIGVNFSNVSNVDDSKSLTGLAAGLTMTYSFTEKSGLTIDLLYSGEGYKVGNNELKLNYLQLPIYYDVFFGDLGANFRPKVYAGIVPAFLLSAKYNDVDVKDSSNSFNVGVSGGLGFNYRLSDRIWLNADLRAIIGLTDIRDKAFQTGDNLALRNIQPSIGIAYGLSKI